MVVMARERYGFVVLRANTAEAWVNAADSHLVVLAYAVLRHRPNRMRGEELVI